MDVKDCLTRLAIRIEDGTVPTVGVTVLFCQRGGASQHRSHKRIILRSQVVERRDVAPRDDEHVKRSLRVDVLEGDESVILMHDRAWNVTRDDLAEQAIGHI